MNYSQILKDLEEATLFDLYRLTSALQEEMGSVERIQKVRSSLRVGQVISWFDSSTHILVKAQILKLNKTRCLVVSIESGEKWNIIYASINTDDKAIHINMNQTKGLKKSELTVGDTITYLSRDNIQVIGAVLKLNPKTAGIITSSGNEWRVPYSILSKIIDIEGEIIIDRFIGATNQHHPSSHIPQV